MQLRLKTRKVNVKSRQDNESRVREHLSNERTYLAWMRTAIALMAFAVLIVRLRAFHPPLVPSIGVGWKLSIIFALVALGTVLMSTQHYFAVRHDIDLDVHEPRDRWVILLSLTVTLLGTGIIYLVLFQ
ncbi:DUF202 domain-containing protein [Kamptonema sp. UHCC 0994]|uniref:YidH family protein n=1 Tax=Kamptonema sp. UHCC 0994 TaxID=3031329 RepID=UPI0023B89427|nr:DUF202 domain-containing protein [Kamptonema sp. UHCC 0994]MDF0554835.1 DUF202 domain-containing protein [Kamptonema sp. UHCC 0994]